MGAIADASYLDSQVLTDLGTLVTQVTTWISGNTYLSIFFTLGLVGIGIALFHKLKNIVR
ncbi:MAG: hypothetical protein MJ055_04885 [Phascolarctobacterium sp.]|nr:hypothetical protein [Phascolarctobacterium sp.]